jgi:type IV pilus assembly protein PilB
MANAKPGKRIGERLSGMVPLSPHDIEEVLCEQGVSGKRFGDIAIELGLCSPEHVWRAWSSQLAEQPQRVDLEQVGIDAQAVARLPAQLAVRFHVIPIRTLGDELVLAIDEAAYPVFARELLKILGGKAIFVLSSHAQIARAIRCYYPRTNAA